MKRTVTDCDRCGEQGTETRELHFTIGLSPRKIAEETASELEQVVRLDLCHYCMCKILQGLIDTKSFADQKKLTKEWSGER